MISLRARTLVLPESGLSTTNSHHHKPTTKQTMPLFYIHYNIFPSAKKNCSTYFASMNEQDDQVDAGKNVKILGRWHCAAKGEGWCVVDSPAYADVCAFLYNWAPMCDVTVEAVLNDDDQREVLMNKYSMGTPSWKAKQDRPSNAEPQAGETLYHITYKFKPGCTATGYVMPSFIR